MRYQQSFFSPSSVRWYPSRNNQLRFVPRPVQDNNQITPDTPPETVVRIISDRLIANIEKAVKEALK